MSRRFALAYLEDFRPYAFADKNGRPVGYYPTAAFQVLPALMYRPNMGHSILAIPYSSHERQERVREQDIRVRCGCTS